MDRIKLGSGTPWETSVGYSRAVRTGKQVFVSGTTASTEDGEVVAVGDAYGQTKYILDKIAAALYKVGASTADVVRTRMYVTDISQWQAIGRAHGEVFHEVRPAATMVQVSALVDARHLVEIEVDAVIDDQQTSGE